MDVSSWPELGAQHHLGRDVSAFYHTDCGGDLLCFCSDCISSFNTTLLDIFREPVEEDHVFVDVSTGINYSGNLPPTYTPADSPIIQTSQYVADLDNNVGCYPGSKRIKTTAGLPFSNNSYDHEMVADNSCCGVLPDLPQPFPTYSHFQGTAPESWPERPPLMSTQTVAARLRRKKISDKTMELGRLVPGGSKMNTAEMYLAAFKYVKFMEAQIGILKFMTNTKQCRDPSEVEGLGALLSSSKMQERMYEEGKCLVTTQFIEIAGNEKHILSSPSVSEELNSLLR